MSKKLFHIAAFMALLTGCNTPENAPTDPGKAQRWLPLSTTAQAITGEIVISASSIEFQNGASLPLQWLGYSKRDGISLYKTTSDANPVLLNTNQLCGKEPINYLVTRVSDASPGNSDMQMTAYYTQKTMTIEDAVRASQSISDAVCGIFTFVSVPPKAAQ